VKHKTFIKGSVSGLCTEVSTLTVTLREVWAGYGLFLNVVFFNLSRNVVCVCACACARYWKQFQIMLTSNCMRYAPTSQYPSTTA